MPGRQSYQTLQMSLRYGKSQYETTKEKLTMKITIKSLECYFLPFDMLSFHGREGGGGGVKDN